MLTDRKACMTGVDAKLSKKEDNIRKRKLAEKKRQDKKSKLENLASCSHVDLADSGSESDEKGKYITQETLDLSQKKEP